MSSTMQNLSARTLDENKSFPGYIRKSVAIKDSSFLFGISLLSALSYLGRLGFYSDDWLPLAYFSGVKYQSLSGLLRVMPFHWYRARPLQMLYLTLTYANFRFHPLPYHLCNAFVLAGTAVLFYATLRELELPHIITLTVPLVYELLPHFVTDRFWIAAHQAVFSQAFFFLGLYAVLRAMRSDRGWALCLKSVSILCFAFAILSYEVIIGLLPLAFLLIGYRMYTKRSGNGVGRLVHSWWMHRQYSRSRSELAFWTCLLAVPLLGATWLGLNVARSHWYPNTWTDNEVLRWNRIGQAQYWVGRAALVVAITAILWCIVLLTSRVVQRLNANKPATLIFRDLGYLLIAAACLGLTLLYKARVTERATFRPSSTHIVDLVRDLVGKTIRFNLFRYGARLPQATLELYRFSGAGVLPAVIAGLIAISVLLYLNWTFKTTKSALLSRSGALCLLAAGFAVFVLDFLPLITLVGDELIFTTDGISNRVLIAAATGTACVLVGGIMLLISVVVPAKLQSMSFYGAIAAVSMMNFVCIASYAECWAKAYVQQREIISEVRNNVDLSPGSTLLVDGLCRYVGPAPVIEGFYDAGALLRVAYSDETLKGDVVSPYLVAGQDAITTTIWANQVNRYPYSKNLWLRNVQQKITLQLIDSRVARNYFQNVNPDQNSGCPPGTAGFGSPIPGVVPFVPIEPGFNPKLFLQH